MCIFVVCSFTTLCICITNIWPTVVHGERDYTTMRAARKKYLPRLTSGMQNPTLRRVQQSTSSRVRQAGTPSPANVYSLGISRANLQIFTGVTFYEGSLRKAIDNKDWATVGKVQCVPLYLCMHNSRFRRIFSRHTQGKVLSLSLSLADTIC